MPNPAIYRSSEVKFTTGECYKLLVAASYFCPFTTKYLVIGVADPYHLIQNRIQDLEDKNLRIWIQTKGKDRIGEYFRETDIKNIDNIINHNIRMLHHFHTLY